MEGRSVVPALTPAESGVIAALPHGSGQGSLASSSRMRVASHASHILERNLRPAHKKNGSPLVGLRRVGAIGKAGLWLQCGDSAE